MINRARANKAVKFIEMLRHTKGRFAGRPFLLERWQKRYIRDIFGTLNEDGTRQYRTVYIEIPRKNGKSEIAAGVALLLLLADDEPGAEVYSAASDREQASIVFHVALSMIWQEPELEVRCKSYESTKRILIPSTDSWYRVLSADAFRAHGKNASGVIFDELHAQPNRDLWDVLTTSGGTRTQPLTFAITTAGYDKHSICWEQHEYAEKINAGIVEDPTFYSVIYSAPVDADWTDEEVWKAANPALGSFRDIREMRSLCLKAQYTPALQNAFRRLYLNQWTQQESRWMDLRKWDETSGIIECEDLYGEIAYAALDLSSTIDIAAFVLVFPDEDDCYDVLPYFWIPEENIEERVKRDRVPYNVWVEKGLIKPTPGNCIDTRYIRRDINEIGEQYYIKEIAFDRWGATEITESLQDDGYTMVQFGQGFASMNPPTKELMRLVLACRIRHGGHPVLRWMADNMVIRTDPSDNWKPDKSKSQEKIDGMVALIMALDRAVRNQGMIYDERGMLTL